MTFSFKNRLLVAFAAISFLGGLTAKADLIHCGIDLGDLRRWAVFSLGGGVKDSDVTGHSNVYGDIGAAGNGDIDIGGDAMVHGSVYYHTGGKLTVAKKASITGTIHNDAASDAILDQDVIYANNASDAAFNLTVSPQYASLTKIDTSKNMTITGGPNECVVLKLTDFMLKGHAILTLQGTATTAFIINVSKQFSLTDQAKIVLAGGVLASDVLFNVRGTGKDVTLDKTSSLTGILMANMRNVVLKDSTSVTGEVIANHIDIKGDATITNVSP